MKKAIISIIFISLSILILSCGDSTTTPPPADTGNGTTKSITSNEEGSITYNGFIVKLPFGAVPKLQNGDPGTVVISVNTSSTMEQGFPSLPSGYSRVSDFVKVGPEQFVFEMTLRIYLPAGAESSPTGLAVMGYFPETNEWKIVPSSNFTDNSSGAHYLNIDVLQLGYFVLVKSTNVSNPLPVPASGGVQWCTNDGEHFIILTIASVTLDPSYPPGYLSSYVSGLVGSTFVSPNIPGSPFPSDYCRGILPLGTYTFWVSMRHWMSNDIQTYSIPIPATISTSLNWPLPWVYNGGEGFTTIGCQLPNGGSWVAGRPTLWPPPTIPFGSGTMQATLTWVNTSGSATDLDLHLYGPNNLHIFYSSKTSANFSLDRDWMSETGNAIENIYSTTPTIPAGTYDVKVNHYSGASKQFNCRVIVNGSVTNYSGTLSSGEVTARTFTIQ
jgi:hypothetical protein